MRIPNHQSLTVLVMMISFLIFSSKLSKCQCKSPVINTTTKKINKNNNNNNNMDNKSNLFHNKGKTFISNSNTKGNSNKHKTKNLKHNNKNTNKKSSSGNSYNCPKLSEFFSLNKRPDFKQKCKLTQCDVTIQKEQCTFRTVPKKQHCLLFRNLILEMVPLYKSFLNNSRLSFFQSHGVKEVVVNTCSKRIAFATLPHGNFTIIPRVMEVKDLEGSISLPLPIGDYHLLGAGKWELEDLRMKIKFMRDSPDQFNIKGYSEIELLPIKRIGEIFDVDILPNGPVSALLKNINLDAMVIRDCRVYGFVQPLRQRYELAFSGEPDQEEFAGSRIRVFITSSGITKNLAVLLELQDFSPVTLMQKLYGPSVTRATILRDRNQTIALYVSAQPTSQFSSTFMAHGSARWIHRHSKFDSGAYILVTVPFPKRKAVDMKIKLLADSLEFSIPDSEKLYSNLALETILPKEIMHIGLDRAAKFKKYKSKDDKIFSKIRILRLKYFLFNNTYIAATESHLTPEEELAALMPEAKPVQENPLVETSSLIVHHQQKSTSKGLSLDDFFSSEQAESQQFTTKEQAKRDSVDTKPDPLSLAKQAGLL